MSEITVEEFLITKLNNFIEYLKTNCGEDSKIYASIFRMKNDVYTLSQYIDVLAGQCEIKDSKYVLANEKIVDYLKTSFEMEVSEEVLFKIKAYLEMFVNVWKK